MEPELAKRLVKGVREAGIDFLTYLPETRLSQILPLMQQEDSLDLVPVASEAEAVSIGAGAAMGGKQVAVYMEGTGLFVSSYNLLLVGVRFGVPMLLLISYVGSIEDQRNSFRFAPTGLRTEAQLRTLGIEYRVLEDGVNLEDRIRNSVRMMHALKNPIALLFTGEFTP